jgi:hypothetical protein
MADHWTGERIARLGFLVGLGWQAERISNDPVINSTPNNVYRQATRFGLSLREAATLIAFQLSSDQIGRLEVAALSRGVSYEELVRRLLGEISSDASLIDNILDDEREAAA